MLKGCNKSVVFLKNTGSDIFDEAYFVIKPSAHHHLDRDIVKEATRLANGFLFENSTKSHRGRLVPVLFGALLCFSVMLPLIFIF